MSDFKYFFKETTKSIKAFNSFVKKYKKILAEYEELEQQVISNKFVLAELGREEFKNKLKLKKTKIMAENKTIEVRAGKDKCQVFEKSIYKKNDKPTIGRKNKQNNTKRIKRTEKKRNKKI